MYFEQILTSWSNTLNPFRPVLMIGQGGVPSIATVGDKRTLSGVVLATQAGPWLVRNSRIVYPETLKQESFLDDVIRVTSHTAIGVTDKKKLILVYMSHVSLSVLAEKFLSLKCTEAFNCDGGSSSGVKFFDKKWGNKNPKYGVEFKSL